MSKKKSAAAPVFDAFQLAHRHGSLQGSLPLASFKRLGDLLSDSRGEICYELDAFVDPQGQTGAALKLTATFTVLCNRCGGKIQLGLDRSQTFRFVKSEAELNALPIKDDEIEPVVVSASTDLSAWIEDEAILFLPIAPSHPDCDSPALLEFKPAEHLEIVDSELLNPFSALAILKRGTSSRH